MQKVKCGTFHRGLELESIDLPLDGEDEPEFLFYVACNRCNDVWSSESSEREAWEAFYKGKKDDDASS